MFRNIVVIQDGVIHENHLYPTFTNKGMQIAEQKFFDLCSNFVPGWNDYSADDMVECLDDGYVEYDRGSVCISEPLVFGNIPPKKPIDANRDEQEEILCRAAKNLTCSGVLEGEILNQIADAIGELDEQLTQMEKSAIGRLNRDA